MPDFALTLWENWLQEGEHAYFERGPVPERETDRLLQRLLERTVAFVAFMDARFAGTARLS